MNFDYLIDHRDEVLRLTWEHIQLCALAIALALVFAIPLGVLITAYPRLRVSTLVILGAIYTIPSLAFLAFLIPPVGLGRQPAVIVLAAYAQLALVRNFQAGLSGVDPNALEASYGVGMTAWQSLTRVRLPLALPVLIAGMRIAIVSTISLATVTAWINAGGLGSLLFDGIAFNRPSMILAGTVAISALALGVDLLLRLVERMTPASRALHQART
ncbi:MAG: ABC transporter permease [Thermomicrobiales bacterium]|nr:ABC transporter permease [Thermomicrobiales bacterium]